MNNYEFRELAVDGKCSCCGDRLEAFVDPTFRFMSRHSKSPYVNLCTRCVRDMAGTYFNYEDATHDAL